MKIRRLLFVLFFTILSSSIITGQPQYDKTIIASFEELKEAIIKVDLWVLVNLAHPNIVALGGGASHYLDDLTSEYNMYEANDMELKDLTIKQTSKIISANGNLQAMVPYIRSWLVDGQVIQEKHFFLVTSQDKGVSWNFTDMNKYDSRSIKLFIPNYNERLNIYINSINH